ncbi:MAG: hypothetical protein ACOC0N_10305 [Chroococcales cyanobacterium]
MVNQSMPSKESQERESQYRLELLEAILAQESVYPWNPADPEVEAYFATLEEEFCLWDNTEEGITLEAENFFDQLHSCWETRPNDRVKQSLIKRFGNLVPVSWLEAIATQAKRVVSRPLVPTEQLVACVQPLLSQWTEADLQIFARPLVYAMRGTPNNGLETLFNFVRQAPWDELSSVEQVRLSLAIANYALQQLDSDETAID